MESLNSIFKTGVVLDSPGIPDLKELIGKANRTTGDSTPITPENSYIRTMYIASDKINAHGGCFPVEELRKLTLLIPNSPVLVGHRRDSLPIARNFHADLIRDKDGVNWVRSYFYWMKNVDGALTMQSNIDSGIYSECSLCFSYTFPECSVCGDDIRRCPHTPHQPYTTQDGSTIPVFYYYRGVTKVLEISIVYRGANPDTKITKPEKTSETSQNYLSITALSTHGLYDITIESEQAPGLKQDTPYNCVSIERHQQGNEICGEHIDCSAYLTIKNSIPAVLYIDDSHLRGIYRFSRIKAGSKYLLIIRKADNYGIA
ncbi:MAG: hypothetical protein GY855_11010 [candidate division Zixibacteria bacterium]|nr:hypothetical protein [candidate division Zixibacteria bacterium]